MSACQYIGPKLRDDAFEWRDRDGSDRMRDGKFTSNAARAQKFYLKLPFMLSYSALSLRVARDKL